MIGVLGGLFGAMFGSRITAESAEMIEQSNPEYRELADSTTDTPSTPSN